jgi:hypothetical protein
MDLDQRLEALTQSVELLASMHKDNETRMEQFAKDFGQEMKTLGRRNLRLEELVTDIAEGTARLVHVAEAHEHRISRLEERDSPAL